MEEISKYIKESAASEVKQTMQNAYKNFKIKYDKAKNRNDINSKYVVIDVKDFVKNAFVNGNLYSGGHLKKACLVVYGPSSLSSCIGYIDRIESSNANNIYKIASLKDIEPYIEEKYK